MKELFDEIKKLIQEPIPTTLPKSENFRETTGNNFYRQGNRLVCDIDFENSIPGLVEYLNLNPDIKTLITSINKNVNLDVAISLLAGCKHLTTLEISSLSLPTLVNNGLTALSGNSSLTALGLPVQIQRESILPLNKMLNNIKLKTFKLSGRNLGFKNDIEEKIRILQINPQVTDLTFHRCNVNLSGVYKLISPSYHHINSLNLARNPLGYYSNVIDLIVSNLKELTKLNLMGTCLTDIVEFQALTNIKGLTDLNVSHNGLNNQIFNSLSAFLKLTKLNVSCCLYIDSKGINSLLKNKNSALTDVNLGHNNLKEQDDKSVCLLAADSNLKKLNVGHCKLGYGAVSAFMTHNSNLESLNIAQSPLQDNAGQNNIIVQQLQMHPCLTEINLSSCKISNAEAFVLAIHPNLLSLTLINHNIGFLGAIALALSKNLIKLKISYQHNLGWLFLWGNQTLKSLIWRINKISIQELSFEPFFNRRYLEYSDYINLNALGGRNAQLQIQLF